MKRLRNNTGNKNFKEGQTMSYDDVVKMIKQSEKRVDEVLKAARLGRHERTPMPKDKLEMVLNYIVGTTALVLGFILLFAFMYFMTH